ncbi:MAG: 8-amino-7-oxononanoate synthase [Verrucomicrobiales bacterium]|nr:8-amino-7-oxononanoate synthase [Verrucomicrobiales bacterium]
MTLVSELGREWEEAGRAGLRRVLRRLDRVDGVHLKTADDGDLLNFASNDYLGLASHPRVKEAAITATATYGAGSTASRLISGSMAPHHELENALAVFKKAEAALTFSSGYATALGVLPALVGRGDFVVLDRLSHASLVDGARLSGATLRVFRHNDVEDLERIMRWVSPRRASMNRKGESHHSRVLVVTESVFSMDGDTAPLGELVRLKDAHDAWLMVDEAHATGVLGPGRRGWIEALGLTGRVEVPMGTLGKALGAAGGYVVGPAILRDHLIHRGRSFVFSTAPPPAAAAAARAALGVIESAEGAERCEALWQRIQQLHQGMQSLGWPLPQPESPILPLMVGAESKAVEVADTLRASGILIPAIRFPTVPRGKARLRITVSASHGRDDVDRLLTVLADAIRRLGLRPD